MKFPRIDFRLSHQARRIIRIGFGPPTIEPSLAAPHGLWSQECALDRGLTHTAVQVRDTVPVSPAFYPGWRLLPYISLGSRDRYISGLTTHTVELGGLRNSQDVVFGYDALGCRNQRVRVDCDHYYLEVLSFYVPIQRGERIVAVWVCTSGEAGDRESHQFVVHIPATSPLLEIS